MSEVLCAKLSPHFVARIQRREYPEFVSDDDTNSGHHYSRVLIREVPSLNVVTIIETLTPSNKRASSDGREQYLEKREEILRSRTNLVEIDLLRGGKRLPVIGMPPGDYFAIISRGHRRPKADVFHWSLTQPLPSISIPLKKGDTEVSLNLQDVLKTVYDRADYQLSLDYHANLATPLNETDTAWLRQLPLAGRG